jgi:hypothetical protein
MSLLHIGGVQVQVAGIRIIPVFGARHVGFSGHLLISSGGELLKDSRRRSERSRAV